MTGITYTIRKEMWLNGEGSPRQEGGWMGGSRCRMSIIRKGNVLLSNLRNSPVALSNSRNSHVAMSNLRNSPVTMSKLRNSPVACH